MAVEAEADVEEGEAKPAKRGIPRRLLIIAAAGLIVLLAAGAGLYFFVFAGRSATEDAARSAAMTVPETFIFNLPAMAS